jgi:hypothetical protein
MCSPSACCALCTVPCTAAPCRNQCAKEDLYYPHPLIQDVLWWTLYQAEPLLLGSRLRGAALRECMKHIHYEVGGWVGGWVGGSCLSGCMVETWVSAMTVALVVPCGCAAARASAPTLPPSAFLWLTKFASSTLLVNLQDENTRYIDIGPVNKMLNMLACWFEDPDSLAFKKHLPRWACGVWAAGRAVVGNACLVASKVFLET